jgi:hypothetical protein
MATVPVCGFAMQPVLSQTGYICESILKSLPMVKLLLIFVCIIGAFLGLALLCGFINSAMHFMLLQKNGGHPVWKQLGFISCVCYASGSLFIFIARTDLHSYRTSEKFHFFLFFFGFCKWTYFVAENLFVLHCIEYSVDKIHVNSYGYTFLTKIVAILSVGVATAQFIVYLVISFKISSNKIVTEKDKELRDRWYNAGYIVLMSSYGMIFIVCCLMFVVVYKFHKKVKNYNKDIVRTINTVSWWSLITLTTSAFSIIAIAIFQYAPIEITESLARKEIVAAQTEFFRDLFMNTILGFLDFIPAVVTLLVFALQGFSWLPLQNIKWYFSDSKEFENWMTSTVGTIGIRNNTSGSHTSHDSGISRRQDSDVGQRLGVLNNGNGGSSNSITCMEKSPKTKHKSKASKEEV